MGIEKSAFPYLEFPDIFMDFQFQSGMNSIRDIISFAPTQVLSASMHACGVGRQANIALNRFCQTKHECHPLITPS